MTVKITSIADAGQFADERVIMKVSSDDDMTHYAVFQVRTSKTEGKFYAGNVPHVYWFSELKVKSGDFVVLYSKNGTKSEKKNDDGTTSYFFYWGQSNPVWVAGTTPVLVTTSTWQTADAIK